MCLGSSGLEPTKWTFSWQNFAISDNEFGHSKAGLRHREPISVGKQNIGESRQCDSLAGTHRYKAIKIKGFLVGL